MPRITTVENKKYQITALDGEDSRHNKKFFGIKNWFCVVLGKVGSGKSTSVLSILLGPYNKYFNKVWIFSKTAHLDPKFEKLGLPGSRYFDDLSNLEDIIEQCKSDELHKYRKLIIVDDLCAELPRSSRGTLVQLVLNRHHYNVSIMITTQDLNAMSPTIKLNADALAVHEVARKTLPLLFQYYNPDEEEYETLLRLYNHCMDPDTTRGPLIMLMRPDKVGKRYFHGFDRLEMPGLGDRMRGIEGKGKVEQ